MPREKGKDTHKLIFILIVFSAIYFLSITFTDTNFPFSRLAMFAESPKQACNYFIFSEDRQIPLEKEYDLLEAQNIVWRNKTNLEDACTLIKKQFSYLPETFAINIICSTYTEGTDEIVFDMQEAIYCK